MTGRTAVVALCGVLCTARPIAQHSSPDDVTSVLERQTQQLMDAVTSGDRGPWTRYLDDRIVYTAEDGATKSKDELLAELRPLPKEIWGRLRVTRFRTVGRGDTTIANYIAEEDEGYFGQSDPRALPDHRHVEPHAYGVATGCFAGARRSVELLIRSRAQGSVSRGEPARDLDQRAALARLLSDLNRAVSRRRHPGVTD